MVETLEGGVILMLSSAFLTVLFYFRLREITSVPILTNVWTAPVNSSTPTGPDTEAKSPQLPTKFKSVLLFWDLKLVLLRDIIESVF